MFGIPDEHVRNILVSGLYPFPDSSLMEECGELISVIAKNQNHDGDEGIYRQRIIEEMTHVLVSMNMVARQLSIDEENIKWEVLRKAIKAEFNTSDYIWK